jgi:hypothetical protein
MAVGGNDRTREGWKERHYFQHHQPKLDTYLEDFKATGLAFRYS